jgi:L-aminopeptidase/D-esterase-like protein
MRFRVFVTTAVACLAFAWQPAAQERGTGNNTLTAVPGIKVGHFTYTERPTGCTAVIVDGDAVGGVSQRGGAPATRETDLLNPLNMVDKVNAISLSGGSAFGLDAATGISRWLEEHGVGWDTRVAKVPIVPAASIYDLPVGNKPTLRPDAECGYKAAQAASTAPVAEGNVGAGAGAAVGQMGGANRAMKSGLGSASITLPNGLIVGAIVVVNASGDVIDPSTGRVVAGARNTDGTLLDLRKMIRSGTPLPGAPTANPGEHTTIGVVPTNARLSKADATRVALMADDGYARAINPVHTMGDGDTLFVLGTGRLAGPAGTTDISRLGALAAEVMSDAILRAVRQATTIPGIPGLPAVRDLK